MRSFVFLLVTIVSSPVFADDIGHRAWEMESKGDALGARSLLQHEAQSTNASAGVLEAYAEFLDRHHDPGNLSRLPAAVCGSAQSRKEGGRPQAGFAGCLRGRSRRRG